MDPNSDHSLLWWQTIATPSREPRRGEVGSSLTVGRDGSCRDPPPPPVAGRGLSTLNVEWGVEDERKRSEGLTRLLGERRTHGGRAVLVEGGLSLQVGVRFDNVVSSGRRKGGRLGGMPSRADSRDVYVQGLSDFYLQNQDFTVRALLSRCDVTVRLLFDRLSSHVPRQNPRGMPLPFPHLPPLPHALPPVSLLHRGD